MAYVKEDILQRAKAVIVEQELTTIPEVCSYIPCDESTLYSTEDWKIEVLEPIKRELDTMKVSLKAKLKKNWRKEDSNATLQIAAFKLMATDDELAALNTSKVQTELSGKEGGPIQTENKHVVEFHDYSQNGNQSEVQ